MKSVFPLLCMAAVSTVAMAEPQADCDVLLRMSDFTRVQIDGEWFDVVRPGAVEASLEQTGCAPIAAENQRLRDLVETQNTLLDDQETLLTRYEHQLTSYREVLDRATLLNQEYEALSKDYSIQVTRYETVSDELSGVAHDLDDLAGKYRDIASRMLNRYRLGAALGSGDEGGLAKQVHVGMESVNIYLHEYQGNTSALVGTELRW